MIRYKIDIIKELKNKGYNVTRLRNENILSQATLTAIRKGGNITTATLNTICNILKKQPGYILEWIPDHETEQEK
jgi:putative transcriptional regulator